MDYCTNRRRPLLYTQCLLNALYGKFYRKETANCLVLPSLHSRHTDVAPRTAQDPYYKYSSFICYTLLKPGFLNLKRRFIYNVKLWSTIFAINATDQIIQIKMSMPISDK